MAGLALTAAPAFAQSFGGNGGASVNDLGQGGTGGGYGIRGGDGTAIGIVHGANIGGGGGGGANAAGGDSGFATGGAAGTVGGGAGGAGLGGSAGGGGGGDGIDTAGGSLTQTTPVTGGTGGGGGIGEGGGGGGSGGYGIVGTGATNLTASLGGNIIKGGNGGAGGFADGGTGGGGGDGGVGAWLQASGSVLTLTSGTISGGNGGNGGASAGGPAGGNGGAGGVGVLANGLTISNAGKIIGGNGGTGGPGIIGLVAGSVTIITNGTNEGGTLSVGGVVGWGGIANAGTLTGAGSTNGFAGAGVAGSGGIANAGTVTGAGSTNGFAGAGVVGSGGIANAGTVTGAGPTNGFAGAGGAGIVGSDLTISNTGTIQGGVSGDGVTQNYAIVFTGGANSVGGTGKILGGIDVQAGSFAPALSGSAIGTPLTVGGPITFAPGTTYVIRVSPTGSDSLSASGAATLTGATVNAQFTSGSFVSKTYTILTATGGLGGTTFEGLTNLDLPLGGTDNLSYDTDDVYLNLTAGFTNFTGLNVNQQNVANALTNFFNANGGIPAQFFNLTPNGLTQIDGENGTGAEKSALQLVDEFLDLLINTGLFNSGGGGTGFLGNGLGFAPDQEASFPPDIALAYAGVLKAPPPSHPSPASGRGSGWGFEQRWTAWGAGFGGSATANGNAVIGSTNVTTGTFGYAAGADYHYSPDTLLGFAVAGGGTNWNLAQGLGTGRSDAFLAGIYGVTHQGPAYVAGALAFANDWFTTSRTALGDQLTANFSGQSYAARLEAGYRFVVPGSSHPSPASGGGLGWGPLGIAPYAAIQAQDFRTPAYSETDLSGGGFGLSYAAMSGTDTRSELGARFDDPTLLGAMPLILRAKLAWAHDWVSNPALNAAFESLPGTGFTVFGAPIPHNSALTSAGAQLFFTPRWSLTAKFDGEFAAGAQTYAGSGTLRYTW